MNKVSSNILQFLCEHPGSAKQDIVDRLALPPQTVAHHMGELQRAGYIKNIDGGRQPTEQGLQKLEDMRVKNAVILAAEPGVLFVPGAEKGPRGLIKVRGEVIIERLIRQLTEAGVRDITVCVGYQKEQYEYLIDRFDVKLLIIRDYKEGGNLSTLYRARLLLSNTYVMADSYYSEENPFSLYDSESWHGERLSDRQSHEWHVVTDAAGVMKKLQTAGDGGSVITGPAHFTGQFSKAFIPLIERAATDPKHLRSPWQIVLMRWLPELPPMLARPIEGVHPLSTLSALKDFDASYRDKTEEKARREIAALLKVKANDIEGMTPTTEGMNNRSYIFTLAGKRYIFRKPDGGSNVLVSRKNEHNNYQVLVPTGLVDEPIYINAKTGLKITPFYEGSRIPDGKNPQDVAQVVDTLRRLHSCGLEMDHDHSHQGLIKYYERLARAQGGVLYRDYAETREMLFDLDRQLKKLDRPRVCCHNDAASVNFLRLEDGSMRIIDWEYGGMGDPFNDLASYAVFPAIDQLESRDLLALYLERAPTDLELARLYGCTALTGMIWCLWSEYKTAMGVDYGDFGMMNYRIAKVYAQSARDALAGRPITPTWRKAIVQG